MARKIIGPNEEFIAIVLLNGYHMLIKLPSKFMFTPTHYCCPQSSSVMKGDINNERYTSQTHN